MVKGIPRISTFIIAMIWIGFFATIFGSFLANMTTEYAVITPDIGINRTGGLYNKLDELSAGTESYRDQSQIDEPTGLTDLIGGYFSGAYKVLQTTTQSIDIFRTMTDTALADDSFNFDAMKNFRMAIYGTILVLIFLGVLVSALIKKDI